MDAEPRSSRASYGGRGPGLLALSWAFFSAGVIVVALRTYTTLFIVRRPKWDLYFTLIAAALAVTSQPFIVKAIYKGVGNDVQKVAPADLVDMLFWQWCYYIPVIISTIFSKLAVATLILQIQDRTFPVMRYILYVIMTITIALGISISSAIFTQCDPVDELWTTDPNSNPNCKNVDLVLKGGTVQGSFSAFGDFFLAIYPAVIFWNLQMSWRRRLGVCVLFLGGAVSGIGAILKTVYVLGLKSSINPTGATADLMTWAHVEVWLIIIMATLPPLRPLFVKCFRTIRTNLSSLSSTHRKSRTANSSAGFYELDKSSSAKHNSHHLEIECKGSESKGSAGESALGNSQLGGPKRRGETWMDGSSEEDILADTRARDGIVVLDPGFLAGPALEEGSSRGSRVGFAEEHTGPFADRGVPQSHVVAQVRQAHVRDYSGIRVDRHYVVESMERRNAGSPGVGGDRWRNELGKI
ncbi:hypothetical protein CAC42_3400 [Sphaceloma murrayae]|uniref:Rhodopsin domain-containing protein n=1 Tax=Sphaceloma murrayae TaxID=2082308 RepID=A0A2K1R1J1_9PEZI|nr:hypothetical protein CAC42_3400 [Sphaceloma murrayae]